MGSEKDLIADALESMYELKADELSETDLASMPIYSSLSQEAWRYQGESLIARGGMKSIFKAYDPKTSRYIAIAKLHEASPEELFEPFLREARLTSFLEHPNIISIYDIGLDEESLPFFTMELKTGEGFDKIIKKEHLKSEEALSADSLRSLLNIFLKICEAMAYAHSKNVLHLDLKPENIQVGHYGEVLVCDWGLGKIFGSEDKADFDQLLLNPDLINNMTLNGELKGTPGYMAPEQIKGQSELKTKQADIYALGSILYTLVSSFSPAADTESLEDLSQKVLKGDLKKPEEYKKVPRALSAIIKRAMEVDLEKRYPSVGKLIFEVNSYLNGFSPEAEQTSPVNELRLFYQRNRRMSNLSLFFIVILVVSTHLYFLEIKSKELEARHALQLLEKEKEEKQKISQDAAPTHFKRARNQLNSGDLEQAYEAAKLGYLLNPDNIENQNLMALILFVNRDYQEANKYLQKISLPLFEKLKRLNDLYLTQNYSTKKEGKLIWDILFYCKWILSDSMTLTLFLHWVDDPSETVREQVQKFMKFRIEDSKRVLNYARYECDKKYSKVLYNKVLNKLEKKPDWLGRRIPAALGSLWAPASEQRECFKEFIPTNLALGQKVSSSGGNEKPPEGMVDGNLAHHSEWAASPHPAHATVDLAGLHSISKLKVYFREGSARMVYKYKLYVSTDGKNFERVVDRSNNTKATRKEAFVFDIEPKLARYVRIEILHNPINNGVHVRELEVYAEDL